MTGNTNAASIWADANVYITDNLAATLPPTAQDAMPELWSLVGLLDGDAGFEEERSEDTSDFYAWGGILVRTSRKNFALTRKFTALEDNPFVRSLVWPGSTATKRVVPKRHKFKVAFETIDGTTVKRVMSTMHAEVSEVGTIKDGESDLTKYEITVKIYPNAAGELMDVQGSVDGAGSLLAISVTPATRTVKVGQIGQPLVVTGTFADGTTRNLSSYASWSSLAPTKATVSFGYVTGIAIGTAKVTASYQGQNAVCDVTVEAA
jgi:hypothetical protein